MDTTFSTTTVAQQLEIMEKKLPVNYTSRNVSRLNAIFMQYVELLNQQQNNIGTLSEEDKNNFIDNIGIARYSLSWKTGRMHFAKAHSEMLKWIRATLGQIQNMSVSM